MGKSFKDYVTALGYWGLLVIIPIALDVIGIYQLITNTQVLSVPFWIWFLIAFILMLLIPFIAFHKLRVDRDQKQNRIIELENKKPSICITPYFIDASWYLDVLNNGEKGIFSAQISILRHKNQVLNIVSWAIDMMVFGGALKLTKRKL